MGVARGKGIEPGATSNLSACVLCASGGCGGSTCELQFTAPSSGRIDSRPAILPAGGLLGRCVPETSVKESPSIYFSQLTSHHNEGYYRDRHTVLSLSRCLSNPSEEAEPSTAVATEVIRFPHLSWPAELIATRLQESPRQETTNKQSRLWAGN